MTRLSQATLDQVRAPVRTPNYDLGAVRIGVVHFGPGAFHRAHQAYYFDEMLARDPGFGVCGVSLHSATVSEALGPQDGLYTLVEREAEPTYRVIGAIRELLVAPREPEQVLVRLASPDLRIVTATVTEKGYCLTAAGELDLDHPDIRHDLGRPPAPHSFPGWLVEGLARRRAAGLPPPVVISCDNLSGNGEKLGRAVAALAEARGDAALAAWIGAEVAFPNSMVDSITPATDDELRTEAAQALGLEDAWPIQRERFVQWVVEDRLGRDADAFRAAGVTVAADIAPFERAKLRLLNGAHSTLAYVGLALGHETVAQAMGDARLAAFVERMMREDVIPTLGGLDVADYIGQVLDRFRNPAIVHRLSQIAWDGSQKLRFRLLETIAERLDVGLPVGRPAVGVAAWMAFIAGRARSGEPPVDPLAEELVRVGAACDGGPGDVDRFLALDTVFPARLAAHPRFREALARAYGAFAQAPENVLG